MSIAIFGDSIAVGVAAVIKASVVVAQVGWPTTTIAAHTPTGAHAVAIISAGSNDPNNPQLRLYLDIIRHRVAGSKRVIWILPQNKKAATIVAGVASENKDATIGFHAGRDGIHPASYGALAEGLKELF